ncbi:hypothetical protein Pcinc_016470 [Petrolisthes cinctipes]|uniref:Peptidase S1 domain-containing protein n=1 Tax=Petrolisthes cinctipes TaxID=88211 RepID=A0AAE1FTM1_PETCI|nr:hypothetical protein Pcinc_016470 [Petrolisthes cinctipes]
MRLWVLLTAVVVLVLVVEEVGARRGRGGRGGGGGGGGDKRPHRKRHNRKKYMELVRTEGREQQGREEVRRWWENQPGDRGDRYHHHQHQHHRRPPHQHQNSSRRHPHLPSIHRPGRGGSSQLTSTTSWMSSLSDLGPHDLADLGGNLYTGWSTWSRCSRRCKQRRRRSCRVSAVCGKAVLKEERGCAGGRCSGRRPFHIIRAEEFSHQPPRNDMRVLLNFNSMFYTRWSRWSTCTRSCLTRRYRSCKYPLFCGGSVVHEEAYCYVEGSLCEKWYRRSSSSSSSTRPGPHHNPPPSRDRHVTSLSPTSSTASMTNWPSQSTPTPSSSTLSGECGMSQVTQPPWDLKIIGGRPAQPGEWPWQVVILNKYHEAFCGGTVVGSRWVLTAAHCVRRKLFVRLAEHDLAVREGPEMEYKVWRSITHPQYDATTVDNDVALLELPEDVAGSGVGPACLPEQGAPLPVGEACTIIGWGKERNTHIFGTDVLHEAEVPIISHSLCSSVYRDYYITDNMFCAGDSRGRVDSCAGDSGGPLLCRRQNRWYIYGITSFGDGCGKRGKFGIYARVSNYRHWIQSVMAA